jgi:hypothetical protein
LTVPPIERDFPGSWAVADADTPDPCAWPDPVLGGQVDADEDAEPAALCVLGGVGVDVAPVDVVAGPVDVPPGPFP